MKLSELMQTLTNKNGEMENTMIVVKANDDIAKITFGKNLPKLKDFQELVDGYIEPVYINFLEQQGDYFVLADEEAIMKDKPFNNVMSVLFGAMLFGDVIIMNKKDFK
jgi:hypothetical protein